MPSNTTSTSIWVKNTWTRFFIIYTNVQGRLEKNMMITKSNLDLIQGYKAGLKLVMVVVTGVMMMMTVMMMISAVMMLKMVVMIAEKQSGFKGILLQPASIHQPPRHPIYFRPPWISIKQMREQISIFFYPFIQTVTKFKFNWVFSPFLMHLWDFNISRIFSNFWKLVQQRERTPRRPVIKKKELEL